ncbi:hypothetical protein [Desulfonatronum parangueonense]
MFVLRGRVSPGVTTAGSIMVWDCGHGRFQVILDHHSVTPSACRYPAMSDVTLAFDSRPGFGQDDYLTQILV